VHSHNWYPKGDPKGELKVIVVLATTGCQCLNAVHSTSLNVRFFCMFAQSELFSTKYLFFSNFRLSTKQTLLFSIEKSIFVKKSLEKRSLKISRIFFESEIVVGKIKMKFTKYHQLPR